MTSNTKEGVIIRSMVLEDYENVKLFMKKEYFTAEPLCKSSGEAVHLQNEKENDAINISMIAQGTSLLALDENDGGRIVGFVLAGAELPEDVERNCRIAETLEDNAWGRIFRIIAKAEHEANIFERYGISKALYSHVTCVAASMRGKGLGSRLAATLMDLGRSRGFPAMVAYCTSFYSARQKEALGMQCIYSLDYTDYKDDRGRVIFTPAAPHTTLQVMAIKL
ncbi:arylalkylamine N-acetyltransferase-like 2 [Drosophila takahashii]|uniref:arylalkylamine N-acetyltransferase-like 2 n=1 Tax=Drosophila takahashii TaxID=29030 RepID=UPI001CF8C336|nr:arylalkylamine N-acetyltransferase-like 2 [Drosophila takahashii]